MKARRGFFLAEALAAAFVVMVCVFSASAMLSACSRLFASSSAGVKSELEAERVFVCAASGSEITLPEESIREDVFMSGVAFTRISLRTHRNTKNISILLPGINARIGADEE